MNIKYPNLKITYIFLLTLLIYGRTLFFGFESDDYLNLGRVSEVVNYQSFLKNLALPTGYYDYFRPLHFLYFFILYKVFGNNPTAFHLFNLVLYLLNIYLVYLLSKRLLKSEKLVFISAVFFALHPAHSHVVSWVSLSNELLKGVFCLLSIIFIEKSIILSVFFYLFALFSKESAFFLPVLIYFYMELRDVRDIKKKISYFILPVLIYLFLRKLFLPKALLIDIGKENIFLFLATFFEYLKIVFIPINFSITYPTFDKIENLKEFFWVGTGFFVLYLFLLFYFFKRNKFIFFILVVFIVFLMPFLNIVYKVGPYRVGVRYAYLATLSFSLLMGYLYQYQFLRWDKIKKFLVIFILSYFFAYSWINSGYFHSDIVFAEKLYGERKDLGSLSRLGDSYFRGEQMEKAKDVYEIIVNSDVNLKEVNSDFIIRSYLNLASLYQINGDYLKSEQTLNKALKLFNNDYRVVYNYATFLLNQQKIDEALQYYLIIPDLSPSDTILSATYNNIGMIYISKGLIQEALAFFEKAYNLMPHVEVYKMNYFDTLSLVSGRR